MSQLRDKLGEYPQAFDTVIALPQPLRADHPLLGAAIEQWVPLMKAVAREYRQRCVPHEDAISTGMFQIWKSILDFDEGYNVKFSTFFAGNFKRGLISLARKYRMREKLWWDTGAGFNHDRVIKERTDNAIEEIGEAVRVAHEKLPEGNGKEALRLHFGLHSGPAMDLPHVANAWGKTLPMVKAAHLRIQDRMRENLRQQEVA